MEDSSTNSMFDDCVKHYEDTICQFGYIYKFLLPKSEIDKEKGIVVIRDNEGSSFIITMNKVEKQ